jgi:hypothetical protein
MIRLNKEAKIVSVIILLCIVVSIISFLSGQIERENLTLGLSVMIGSLVISLLIAIK